MLTTEERNIQPGEESIDLRESGAAAIRTTEIQDRINYLLEMGIPKSIIEAMKISKPTLFHKEEVHKKIEELKKLGFGDPIKMIISSPPVLGYNIESMREKIEELKKLGFEDPVKMITSFPVVLGLNIDSIREKIEALKALGFGDPVKMIVSLPAILGLNIESIREKIEELKKLGFRDPIKMMMSLPQVLSYNIESIREKIEELKKLGFGDPIKMIVSSPAILNYNIEKNIKPKLTILVKMIQKYRLPYTAISLMESNPLFFSSKRDKLWTLIRILSSKSWEDIDTRTRVSQLLSQNLESTIIGNMENPNLTTIKELIQKSREVKAKHNTKEKEIIIRDQGTITPTDKILARYRRGYNK